MASITLHDVARLAGVSHTTVSWALRHDPRISLETRHKVEAIAQQLGYVPNEVARSLARGSTKTIAIVSPSFSSAFESETLRGIELEMNQAHPDYALVHYATGAKPQRVAQVWDGLLRGNKADAVICLVDPPSPEIRAAFRLEAKPLVLFDEHIEDSPCIRGDSRAGTQLATELLLAKGCRRLGIVSSRTYENGRTKCDPDRTNVFMELCQSHGIQGFSLEIDRFHFETGQNLAKSIIEQGCDGVFCAAGDMVAIGIMAGCRELGVAIPDSLRIVGYDNLLVSSMVRPALSTITQPLAEMGRQAVQTCFALLTGEADFSQPRHARFLPSLVQRESA